MIFAFATDDGNNFISRHFGDAKFYQIYKITKNSYSKMDSLQNTTGEEEQHADPKKASGIANLLQSKDVTCTVARVFGPNIKRINKKFVRILASGTDMLDQITLIQQNFAQIESAWQQGIGRNHLKL
ncbi:MAG: NifB/NifX family molybdenum-iron cluster-binding protein [Candidatus Cloacimonadota bacterium]|nr:NifB/NifX family molybdenum-iron cluster-binding protein [Candidatus Cloacimonadota bacterium]